MSFRFDTVQNALPNNLKKKVFVCVNHRQNHDTVSNRIPTVKLKIKVKNYNLNVTEVRDSDFKNAFPGIFNFTVGILISRLPQAEFERNDHRKDSL